MKVAYLIFALWLSFVSHACLGDPARIISVVVDNAGNRYLFLGQQFTQDIEFYRVVRLKRDGSLDRDWANRGVLDLSHVILSNLVERAQITLTADGDLLVTGTITVQNRRGGPTSDLVLIRVRPDGTVKNNGLGERLTRIPFVSHVFAIRSVTVTSEGKILVATMDDTGTTRRHQPRVGIARFSSDCLPDRGFNSGFVRYIDLVEDYDNLLPGIHTTLRIMPSGSVLIYSQLVNNAGQGMHMLFRVSANGTRDRNLTLHVENIFRTDLASLPEAIPSENGDYLYVSHLSNRGKVEIRRFTTADGKSDRDFGVQVMEQSRPVDYLQRNLLLNADGSLLVAFQSGRNLVLRDLEKNGTVARETSLTDAFESAGSSICHVLMQASDN